MPFTELQIRKAKSRAKDDKLAVERGLYVLIKTTCAKYWQTKCSFEGREISFFRGLSKRQLRDDLDPAAAKKNSQLKRLAESENTCEKVARLLIKMKSSKWASWDLTLGQLPVALIHRLTRRRRSLS